MSQLKIGSEAMRDALVEAFNEQWPVGTSVVWIDGKGQKRSAATRSPAWLLGDGTAVVSLVGMTGGYALALVVPVEKPGDASKVDRPRCSRCGEFLSATRVEMRLTVCADCDRSHRRR